jgi:hypothetical protein
MSHHTPSAIAIYLALLVSGCTTQPLENPSALPAAKLLRPNATTTNKEKIGLALSGGGTKAASYAMGVLGAVVESEKGLTKIDALSSVSGGSYASLFLFSKLMLLDQKGLAAKPDIKDFFADCMPTYYQAPDKESMKNHEERHDRLPLPYDEKTMPTLCAGSHQEQKNAKYLYQRYVRCRQDVLQSDCKPGFNGDDDKNEFISGLKLIGESLAIFVPNFLARSVFDWPVNLSPSRHAYQQGIWSTYGLYPISMETATKAYSDVDEICDKDHFLNCAEKNANSNRLTFEQLKNTLDQHPNYPTWFINASASKKRSFLGWAMDGQRDFSLYNMQMSPYGARSGLYGDFYTQESKLDLDLLEAVSASAAFSDANQTVIGQPKRLFIAAGLHLLGQDWGQDIDNPNDDQIWRYIHNALPFPLYYTDGTLRYISGKTKDETRSAYVHLMDGGNSDDLGVFTLLEAGMQQIYIADSANDSEGTLGDLCLLHNELRIRKPYRKLIIPGLEGLENHCLNVADESENANGVVPGVIGSPTQGHYSILDWKHKVLVGCIRSDNGNTCDSSQAGAIVAKIFLLKPAINLDEMKEKYIDLATRRVKKDACDQEKNPGLCEVAAYLVDSYNPQDEEAHGLGDFPQDSTVWMTANSDAKRYGSYRELGRWHMHEALKLSKDVTKFDQALAEQTRIKISYNPEVN